MARSAPQPIRWFDPAKFQRHVLKHPDEITFFNSYTNRREFDKGGLVTNLTEYCYSAGITLEPEQVHQFRILRTIGRPGHRRTGRAPIDVPHLVAMNKLLYYGRHSQMFMDLLHHYGWWSIREHGPQPPVTTFAEQRRHGQQELKLFPGR